MKKFFLSLFLGLFFIELFLNLLVYHKESPGSFNSFYRQTSESLKKDQVFFKESLESCIFFVGDSTIFGIGASNPDRYSLPAQFDLFLKSQNPQSQVFNFGYPGICTEEGLKILKLLPDGANVIFRAGISDEWNKQLAFRFSVFGFNFELRSLKMFFMLFGAFLPDLSSMRIANIKASLQKTVTEKKLNIYALTYPSSPSLQPFYVNDSSLFQTIPLGRMLFEKGYLDNGIFSSGYRCETLHSNDLGYRIEAIFLFNFFCSQNVFGLKSEMSLSPKKDSDFIFELKRRYDELKNYLLGFKSISQLVKIDNLQHVFDSLVELWSISSLFSGLKELDYGLYRKEHEMISRLRLFMFHDIKFVVMYFLRIKTETRLPYSEFPDDQKRCELYYNVMKAIVPSNMKEWQIISEVVQNIEARFFKIRSSDIDFIKNLPIPFPLEGCSRILREGGFEKSDLSVADEWNYFFNIPYKSFFGQIPETCR